jgi:hypothetical protein
VRATRPVTDLGDTCGVPQLLRSELGQWSQPGSHRLWPCDAGQTEWQGCIPVRHNLTGDRRHRSSQSEYSANRATLSADESQNQHPRKIQATQAHNKCRDRIGAKGISNRNTDYRSDLSRPHLLTAGHTRVSSSARTEGDWATNSNPPDPHPSRQSFDTARRVATNAGKPHGLSPYAPGRAPGPGISRRSGSVAYILADALLSEVLARTSSHRKPRPVKSSPAHWLR